MHVTARASAVTGTTTAASTGTATPATKIAPATGLTLTALALFGCYLRLSSTQRVTADGASQALQAWDMLHGNWLLHGWTLTDVSFYTTELPQYVLIEAADGLRPDVAHLAGAMTYALLIVAVGLLARGRTTGRPGLIRLLVACGIMLAPQPGNGVGILLTQPDHVGTMVPVLLVFGLVDRAPRRWWVPAVAGAALAWVQVADRLAMTVAVLPLAAVCAFRAYQGIVRRREPLATRWPELSLGAAALASTPAAMIASRVLASLGGYTSLPLANAFAPSSSWPSHVVVTVQGILALYGSDVSGQRFDIRSAVALIHLAGLVLAGWALCRTIRRFGHGPDLITQVLAAGVVFALAAYLVSPLATTIYSAREIVAVLPFGAVLAGRVLGDQLAALRLLPLAGAVLAGYCVALLSGMAQPARAAVGQDLAGWLTAHHLTTGLASYAQANSVTLASGGAVQLRAPDWTRHGIRPGAYASRSSSVRPEAARRDVRGVDKGERLGLLDLPPGGDPGVRQASTDVSLPRLHDLDLAREPAHPATSRRLASPRARRPNGTGPCTARSAGPGRSASGAPSPR